MKYYCNPLNLPYKYQLLQKGDKVIAAREAADPSLVMLKGRYYLFPSMTGGFYISDDLVDWEFHSLPENVPVYDYAPDVRVMGEYLYFSASKLTDVCSFFRTRDPVAGKFEEIPGSFPFFDPNLFVDDDGRVYFYWGCSNSTPIYGIELDPATMQPMGERCELIFADEAKNGFERTGEDHVPPKTTEMIEAAISEVAKAYFPDMPVEDIPPEALEMTRKALGNDSYIEGAWMTKHGDTYYLQYAASGTEYNIYNDGVYVSKNPLGPFSLAENNPFSYKPGGFLPGAGHGSTMEDKDGQWWHASTMRIGLNFNFERRLGLWQAGFDADGELFCDQRYGDWPMHVGQKPWEKPEWMLLSYGKKVRVSSGSGAENVTDENVRTWWKAGSAQSGEWAEIDLGEVCDVRAAQVNFADDALEVAVPGGIEFHGETDKRIIDQTAHFTRWKLEGSVDGTSYFILADKSGADTDLPHDLIVEENGVQCRYLRLTVIELPFGQAACVSGLRVFGKAGGPLPMQAAGVKTTMHGDLDMLVSWDMDGAVGHNILWGHEAGKLYHSCMVFGKNEQSIGALVRGTPVYVRVDAFNENGITEGQVIKAV